MTPLYLLLLAASLLLAPAGKPDKPAEGWQSLGQGLDVRQYALTAASPVGNRKLTALRIDPAHWQFSLLTAKEHGSRARTARQWATDFGQTAVANAGMFQMDGLTNVGYMKVNGKINNPRFNDDNTLVAAQPIDPILPSFQIIDRECQDWKHLVTQYQHVTQGIRMVDCRRKNRWSEQPRIWSMVVIGMDKAGRGLLLFCRSPYSVHSLIDQVLALDLDLQRAMYLEGGPEASLYIKTSGYEFEGYGSYETGFYESDGNDRAWPIPNVIGIAPRPK